MIILVSIAISEACGHLVKHGFQCVQHIRMADMKTAKPARQAVGVVMSNNQLACLFMITRQISGDGGLTGNASSS